MAFWSTPVERINDDPRPGSRAEQRRRQRGHRPLPGAGIARYQARITHAIPADDADLRAVIISAVTLGLTVSRHVIKSDELATAEPAQVIRLLRPVGR